MDVLEEEFLGQLTVKLWEVGLVEEGGGMLKLERWGMDVVEEESLKELKFENVRWVYWRRGPWNS